MNRLISLGRVVAAGLFLFVTSLAAQDPAKILAGEEAVEKAQFEKLVETQPKAALAELATAWIDRLKAEAEKSAVGVEGADVATIAERAEAVVSVLENAGGDEAAIADHREFIARVTDAVEAEAAAETEVEPSAIIKYVTDWVTSTEENGGVTWGLNILKFLLALLAFRIIANIAGRVVGTALNRFKQGSELLRKFFVNAVKKVIFFIGVVIALSFIGVPTGPFLAALGAAGFVIGFALQGTLNNFAAGIMILLYRPYDIGDFVNIVGTAGSVKDMSLVSTTLTTPDNQVIVVPNGSIWGDVITNVTGNDTRRVDFTFGIGYSDDIAKAQAVMERVLASDDRILKEPEPVIKVHELADSSVNFVCRPWSKTSDYWGVYWDITRKVKEEFDKEGISIPFPQTDIHVHKVEG
eukprot:jgi/Undpi1/11752/HiC_scaffold_37.g14047.m1